MIGPSRMLPSGLGLAWCALLVAGCTPAPHEAGVAPVASAPATSATARLVAVPAERPTVPAHPPRVLTNTEHVESVAVDATSLWVATRGGVERYSLATLGRERVYTTADGLDANHVWWVRVAATGSVTARTRTGACALADGQFRCERAPALALPTPVIARRFRGARETVRLAHHGGELVATAGAGVWVVDGDSERRITPVNQICSNHMMAIAEWGDQMWFGSFDDGVCATTDGETFATPRVPFRMVNDLVVTPRGMYVAAAAGLFHTTDGIAFREIDAVDTRGVNGLAFDGKSLWATTPGALYRVRVAGGPATRAYWRPAGTRSLQGVAVGSSGVWLASEDKGLIHKARTGFVAYDRAAGAPSSWALAVAVASDGRAYGATLRDGVVSVDKRGRIRVLRDLPDSWILDVRTVGRDVYVGTQAGAALVTRTGRVSPIPGLPHPNVHAIYVGARRTYVATEAGVLDISEV